MSRDLYILSFSLTIFPKGMTTMRSGECMMKGTIKIKKKNQSKFYYFINGRHTLFLVAGPLRGGGGGKPP